MRKGILLSALLTPLLLLGGCFGQSEAQKNLDLALTIRGEYLSLPGFTAQAALTADYGQRVYDYELDVDCAGETTTLTIAAPELLSGITARWQAEEGFLEYDGVSVETGPLTDDGLTPMSAVPALLEAARSAYITACCLEDDGLLRVDCGSPDTPPGTGTEFVLWFTPDTHDLVRGEILRDGVRTITCTFSQFTKEGSA